MISISTPTFDLSGSLIIRDYDPSTDVKSRSRRVSRTATLDGGCVIEDNGLSHSDRTLKIISKGLSALEVENLERLIEFYSELYVSTAEGVFAGVMENLNQKKDEVTVSFLVERKIT